MRVLQYAAVWFSVWLTGVLLAAGIAWVIIHAFDKMVYGLPFWQLR